MPVPAASDPPLPGAYTGSGTTYPGAIGVLTLLVDPYDATTRATVTIHGPGPATLTPTATTTDGGHTWVAMPLWTAAGEWVPTWTITNTGAGVWVQPSIWVSAIPSPSAVVAWRPELWNVAAYIPRRTLVGAVDGYGNALETFTADTHPSASAVQSLISDACAWVGLVVNPVAPTLDAAARACASIYTAALIELTFPDNRDDVSTADALLKRAEAMRTDLDRANEAVTGTDPEDPAAVLMPVWSFPRPVSWGDSLL